jgi:hypothetical protein
LKIEIVRTFGQIIKLKIRIMDERFIVIIWHQAGGNNENKIFYPWVDENDNTRVFSRKEDAEKSFRNSVLNKIHSAFVVECTASEVEWII